MYQEDVKEVQNICSQYEVHSPTKLDKLKKLDRDIKRPAEIVAYTIGVTGSLVLGTGMSLAMKVIGNLMPLGIVIGCIGIIMLSANYFVYKKIIKDRKKKYSYKILDMANEMLNQE